MPRFHAVDNGESEEIMQSVKQQESTSATPLPKRKRKFNARESQEPLVDCQFDGSLLDNAIASYLQKENSRKDAKEDADEMFCRSLIPILSALPTKKIRKQRWRYKNYFFHIELDNETD